ncbi:hypothetical protein KQI63_03645 [bacterium]|nr:hypothetical protein [bacterium]
MIQFEFAGVRIGLHRNHDIPEVAVPDGFRAVEEDDKPDIFVDLSVGNASMPEPEGEPRLKRGRLEAYGDPDHMLWWHPDLGTIIELHPRAGKAHIALPASAWLQTESIFDQLLLPTLLPPLAARGVRALHASAVDMGGNSVMIAGHSGSGKTTTALLLLSQHARLVSDDLLFLYRDEGSFRIAGLGDGLRARDDVWSRFNHLKPGRVDPAGKRHLANGTVPWVRASRPRAAILVGFDALRGKLNDIQALPALLSLAYHAGDETQALGSLRTLCETIHLHGAGGSEEAATRAMQLLGS